MTVESGYFVDDPGSLAGFYADALGCTEVVRMELPESVTVPTGLGDPALLVVLRAPDGTVLKFMSARNGFGEATSKDRHDHYITFYTEQFDETAARMLAAGGAALTNDFIVIPAELGGGRMRFMSDPQGNAIELIEGRPSI